MKEGNTHQPVLLKEAIECLQPKEGGIYIDATVNGGGHAREIARMAGKKGRVIGIDWDCDLIGQLEKEHIPGLELFCENFAEIASAAEKLGVRGKTDGIVFDFGFSSYHIEKSKRGFSFARDEPLDMRYHLDARLNASDIINKWPEEKIRNIIGRYGEERFARRIAQAIAHERAKKPIRTSGQLAEIISRSVSRFSRRGRIHPATRTFQALRIAVNDELGNVERGLEGAFAVLRGGGIIAAISFHSLEDRIVKRFIQEKKKEGLLEIMTKKPLQPEPSELISNPRSRSARLRAFRKMVS